MILAKVRVTYGVRDTIDFMIPSVQCWPAYDGTMRRGLTASCLHRLHAYQHFLMPPWWITFQLRLEKKSMLNSVKRDSMKFIFSLFSKLSAHRGYFVL